MELTPLDKSLIHMLKSAGVGPIAATWSLMRLQTEEEKLEMGFFIREYLDTGLTDEQAMDKAYEILTKGVDKHELSKKIENLVKSKEL